VSTRVGLREEQKAEKIKGWGKGTEKMRRYRRSDNPIIQYARLAVVDADIFKSEHINGEQSHLAIYSPNRPSRSLELLVSIAAIPMPRVHSRFV
jgi:hypothetical protein